MAIVHPIWLHVPLSEAHRKHAYQLMANELKIGHVKVSLLFMALQLVIFLVFIYLIPDTVLAHWIYLVGVIVVLGVGYVWLTFSRACSCSAMLKQAWTLLSLTRSLHEEVLSPARGVFSVVESKKIIFLNLGRYIFELCLNYAPFVPTYKRYPDSAVCTAVA